jgi:hypothetical protein
MRRQTGRVDQATCRIARRILEHRPDARPRRLRAPPVLVEFRRPAFQVDAIAARQLELGLQGYIARSA